MNLRSWWDKLLEKELPPGYFPKTSKSWLAVKEARLEEAKELFCESILMGSFGRKRHEMITLKIMWTSLCHRLIHYQRLPAQSLKLPIQHLFMDFSTNWHTTSGPPHLCLVTCYYSMRLLTTNLSLPWRITMCVMMQNVHC